MPDAGFGKQTAIYSPPMLVAQTWQGRLGGEIGRKCVLTRSGVFFVALYFFVLFTFFLAQLRIR